MQLPWSKDPKPADLIGRPYADDFEDPKHFDQEVYEDLLSWRNEYAEQNGVRPEDVLLDSHMKHAAAEKPSDDEELREIGLDGLRIELIGGMVCSLSIARQVDWRGARFADSDGSPLADYTDNPYVIEGEDEVKNVDLAILLELDTLDETLDASEGK